MTSSKGLKRLVFLVVFLIPVCWYLFLQLFGDNKFVLDLHEEHSSKCGRFGDISVIYTSVPLHTAELSCFNRIAYRTEIKKVPLVSDSLGFIHCMNYASDMLLVDEEGIWGAYELSREGVDNLLTELDILIFQKSYGKGVSR